MAELALSRRTARSAARALSVALAADSGVTHVGVGWKLTGGTPTDQLALKVFVTRKHDQPTVAVPDSFTHAGQEYATDVVRTGARPRLTLAGGDRIFAGNGVPGVCGLVFTYLGKTYGLTNAHVVGGAGGPASRPVTGLSNGQTIVVGRVA